MLVEVVLEAEALAVDHQVVDLAEVVSMISLVNSVTFLEAEVANKVVDHKAHLLEKTFKSN